jgi:hypothetical protein
VLAAAAARLRVTTRAARTVLDVSSIMYIKILNMSHDNQRSLLLPNGITVHNWITNPIAQSNVRVEPRVSSNKFTLPEMGEITDDDDDDNDEYLDSEREQPVAVEQRTTRALPSSPPLTFSDAAAAAADMSRPQIAAPTRDDLYKARLEAALLEEEYLLSELANEAQVTAILAVGRKALDDIVKLHPELAPKKE